MKKADAIANLGGSVASAAAAIGITSQAISMWPTVLTPRIADRVVAALVRQPRSAKSIPKAKNPISSN